MRIEPIKTRQFLPPKDDLFEVLKKAFKKKRLKENSVIVITSKIVSISQGRCVKLTDVKDKDELIKKEADFYLPREKTPKGWVMLTIKHNILIPTAGIDESNANGYYILWPEDPFLTAKKIHDFLKKEFGLKKFGVIISDSHTTPLRYGTMGIALSYWGFSPLKDYRGAKDIFGREMLITQQNIADSLAVAAVLVMGEGKEQTPLAVIEDVEFVRFLNFDFRRENPLSVPKEIDIYGPLLNAMEWGKGGNGD
ncbi:MAG: coenzyme F420-0:L-glutamate ligase [Candidatus Spechtbacteria bacterium]|nr:coenzyme F420-0:L-glutamate ligase [Candidatus Spechtbacteria bacterium]